MGNVLLPYLTCLVWVTPKTKPSELMDSMLSRLGQHQPRFLFRQIFLQQLLEHILTSLSVLDLPNYRTLAHEADKLFLAGGTNAFIASQNNVMQSTDRKPQIDAVFWYHQKYGDKARNVCHRVPSTQPNAEEIREMPGRATSSIMCWPA
ncbi:Gag pol protein [Elysia marginata]|uniref:Gag pol protein n=1 Tax=Elysia marginata TaxID=1093978 RepID=A0AAV4ET07_9GAST|nr:Gag pol protein [Elysia marginata]